MNPTDINNLNSEHSNTGNIWKLNISVYNFWMVGDFSYSYGPDHFFLFEPSYPPTRAPWSFLVWGTAFIVEWHAPALFEPAVNCDGVTAYLLGPEAICEMIILLCDLVRKKKICKKFKHTWGTKC